MPLSIDELRRKVEEYHNKGLNSQQIADELSLSQTTIQWLSSSNVPMDEETPSDIRVGWRSVAVKAARVEAVSYVCLLYTSPSPRDKRQSRMPSSA